MSFKVTFLALLLFISGFFARAAFYASSGSHSYPEDNNAFQIALNKDIKALSDSTVQKLDQIDTLIMKAASSKKKRDFQEAINLYNRALALSKKQNAVLKQSTVHYYLGEAYLEVKNYTMAIGEFEACRKLKTEVSRPGLFARVSFHLGAIYSTFKNYELALNYYKESLKEFRMLKENYELSEVLDSLGGIYLAQGNRKEALKTYINSLEYKRGGIPNIDVAGLLMKIGTLYLDLNESSLSLKYLEEALKYVLPSNNLSTAAEVYNKIGMAHSQKGKYEEAEKNFQNARDLSERVGDRKLLVEAYKNLSITYEKLNQKSQELSYFRKYINLKDSLLAEENQKSINEMKAEFDVQNKQKTIEILEHQKALLSSQAKMKDMAFRSNRILLIFLASVIVLSIAFLLLLMRRHIAKKNSNLILQNHLAEVRQQKTQIEVQRDIIERNNKKLEKARRIIVQKNILLEENNSLLERTINERTLELYKAYQKLSFHVDNTSLAVMEFNDRLELIRWSDQAEKIFGWKAEEVLGKRFHESGFVLEKDIDEHIKAIHGMLYGDSPRIFVQTMNRNKWGDILHIEWNTSVLLNKDGSVDSIMAIANDVTRREEAFVELQSSHRELDNFIYKASHDLRGPLARIQGVVNLGLMEVKEKLARDYFTMLHITSNQLNNILSRLLMIYDINHHKIKVESIVLKEEIKTAVEELKQENDHVNIQFKLKIEDNMKWKTDQVLFRIIIKNMFDNALFFRDKKEIKVELEAQQIYNEKLLIKITDNGLGIPDNVRERVFDMFFHGAAKSGGTGLGLYMSKKAVERLGGTIQLMDGEARHTVFKILLPKATHTVTNARNIIASNLTSN